MEDVFFPLLNGGAKEFKEKWARYKKPKAFKKNMSLFVSPNGEYVAIAAGNQITILQKGDDYMHPTCIFTSESTISNLWSTY